MKIDGQPPTELLDPDGEGIYLINDWSWENDTVSVLFKAAHLLNLVDDHGRLDWRAVKTDLVYMEPREGTDEWFLYSGRRWLPRYWRLNLPRARRPVCYAYCTPKS